MFLKLLLLLILGIQVSSACESGIDEEFILDEKLSTKSWSINDASTEDRLCLFEAATLDELYHQELYKQARRERAYEITVAKKYREIIGQLKRQLNQDLSPAETQRLLNYLKNPNKNYYSLDEQKEIAELARRAFIKGDKDPIKHHGELLDRTLTIQHFEHHEGNNSMRLLVHTNPLSISHYSEDSIEARKNGTYIVSYSLDVESDNRYPLLTISISSLFTPMPSMEEVFKDYNLIDEDADNSKVKLYIQENLSQNCLHNENIFSILDTVTRDKEAYKKFVLQ